MNNIKRSRVHPIGIIDRLFTLFKGLWIVVIYALRDNELKGYLILLGIFLLMLVIAVISYLVTTYEVIDNVIVYRKGIFNKKIKSINLENIQSLDTSSNVIYQIFNLVSLDINLVGDTIRIKPLKKSVALAIIENLNSVRKSNSENLESDTIEIVDESRSKTLLSLSIKQLVFYGLLRVRVLAAVGLLIAFYDKIRQWVYYIFDSRELVDNYVQKGVENVGGSVSLLIMVLLIFVVLVIIGSIIVTVVRFYNFILLRKDNNLLCKYGLLNKKSIVIDIDRIQSIKIIEPFRYRFFGLAKLSIETLSKKVSEDLSEQKTTVDLMPLAKLTEVKNFIEDNLELDLIRYDGLQGEKIPNRAKFIMYRWSVINSIYVPLIAYVVLYFANVPLLSNKKIEVCLALYVCILIYSVLSKNYKLKYNELAYDKENFKYTYTFGFEVISEYIKAKKVGTINSKGHYFLNRLNLVHLTINSIGSNSDIHLRYYDKNYKLKLERDFLTKKGGYDYDIY